jgi:hypothetical protein
MLYNNDDSCQTLECFKTTPHHFFYDKQSVFCLVINPKFHCHTKHINVQYHFITEMHMFKEINIKYIITKD